MLPKQLLEILDDLKNQEWIQLLAQNAELYVIGGSVRDAYLSKPIKDVDMVVDGLSISGIQRIISPFGKQSLVGESFSVIKFRPQGHIGEDYDIAIPREDKKVGEGHKGFEIITDGVDIHGDLKRRDFTINSMAVNIMTEELLDPFNGLEDLKSGLIKATDKTAFIEDPLRILRGIQFAARFDFEIESDTKKLMKENSHLIKEITGERIFDEFQKILLKNGNTQVALNLIHETDVDVALFDKKMLKYDHEFENLDLLSFYYMLGLIGGADPSQFYMNRLKGEAKVGKAIKILDTLITSWDRLENEEDKLYFAFMSIQKAPSIADSALIPPDMENIVDDMRSGKIPANGKDIQLNGDDVMNFAPSIKKEQIGFIIERIRRDALMNKFDWRDRTSSIQYLDLILN